MKLHRTILALSLAILASNAIAQTASPPGLLPNPANRVIGLWKVTVNVGACTGGPTQTFIALNTFRAGGTLSDTNAAPPSTRGPGQGVWQYLGGGQYKTRMQYYRFLSTGAYDGTQDVRTTMQLNAHATQYTNTIYARVLNADGSLRAEGCGSAVGERIDVN